MTDDKRLLEYAQDNARLTKALKYMIRLYIIADDYDYRDEQDKLVEIEYNKILNRFS